MLVNNEQSLAYSAEDIGNLKKFDFLNFFLLVLLEGTARWQ